MDVNHGISFKLNNKNYMFSNKLLRKVMAIMKADVGNLCVNDCGYNDYLATTCCSGNKCTFKSSGMNLPTSQKSFHAPHFWSI
jgi:hypothetical protein